ncbi:hypothetical protein PQX77_002461, partial [Marasmius sp. AFHP31]
MSEGGGGGKDTNPYIEEEFDQLEEQLAVLKACRYTLPQGDGEPLSQDALKDMVAEYVSLMSPSVDWSVVGSFEASAHAAPAVVQAAGCAAEAFSGAFARANLINWVITDSRAQLWYFDRECPIQTSDFDFILELPLFLAFLFLLQRFERKHWGYIPEMSSNCVPYKNRDERRTSSIFSTTEERSSWSYGLAGHCTQTKIGEFEHDGRKGFLKLSYPKISRTSEAELIIQAEHR